MRDSPPATRHTSAPRAIIWDMDGVIADSEHLWERMTVTYLQKKGAVIPRNFNDLANQKIRGRDVRLATKFLKKRFSIRDSVTGIHHERMRILLRLLKKHLRPVPHALYAVQKTFHSYRLALVSSSPRSVVEVSLKKLRMKKYFDCIVAGNEVRVAKPRPDIFLNAARKLGTHPSECVVIEDSLAGVQAAKQAGMRCVLLETELATST